MASQGYYDWVAAGKPYALIRPLAMVQANIRRHGITVYDYPDDSHLKAARPEDHTPFSVTGWPTANKRWKARAIDIMPRADTEAARDENTAIALQMIEDKDDGVPGTEWIKYLNYTDDAGDCWHVAWQPNKVVTPSTDAGHVHVSGRSDVDLDTRADEYDPVARLNGITTPSGEDMAMIAVNDRGDGQVYFCIGGFSFPIKREDVSNIKYLSSQGAYTLARRTTGPASEWEPDGVVRKGWYEGGAFGPIWTKPEAANVEVGQETVIAALKSPEGQQAIVDAVNYAEDH